MTIPRSVADVIRDHVVLEYEAIDRMYLNVYVPTLQTVGGHGPSGPLRAFFINTGHVLLLAPE
jgi:hypothetical protein